MRAREGGRERERESAQGKGRAGEGKEMRRQSNTKNDTTTLLRNRPEQELATHEHRDLETPTLQSTATHGNDCDFLNAKPKTPPSSLMSLFGPLFQLSTGRKCFVWPGRP